MVKRNESSLWRLWTLAALRQPPPGPLTGVEAVMQQVAVDYADRFAPEDRSYIGDHPSWHEQVREIVEELRTDGLVRGVTTPALTKKGVAAAESAVQQADSLRGARAGKETAATGGEDGQPPPPLLMPGVIASPLRDREARKKMGLPEADDEPMPVMVELSLQFGGGVRAAFDHLDALWVRVTKRTERPVLLAGEYATGKLSVAEMKRLVAADAVPRVWPQRSIHRLWPDFPVHLHIDTSAATIKVDASRRSFNSYGDRIVWAVIDSGVWGDHPHFSSYATLSDPRVKDLHQVFLPDGTRTADGALADESGHGTHVAGIIAGGIAPWLQKRKQHRVIATENRYNVENSREPLRVPRQELDAAALAGMSPKTKLVSLKVLQRGGTLEDRVSRVIAALAYVREVNAQSDKLMRIHGVNLSVGYEFDAEWFACGQSILCQEVDKLVRSGVVVVVAAGNSGYGAVSTAFDAPARFGLGMTINDPGNAERAITVGSTHRDMPHTYGVSYFSSKGPTGDGRRKPDLVAPGERISSCAAGDKLAAVVAGTPAASTAVYVEETGTSMAAPHVSGAIAAFLSVRREFIGKPDVVKRIFVESATPLGRESHFEGGGLLDLMRALQSV